MEEHDTFMTLQLIIGVMMNPTINEEINKLSIAEKILLVEEIWDSIAVENERVELSDEMKTELDRRSQTFIPGRTWEEIKAAFLQ